VADAGHVAEAGFSAWDEGADRPVRVSGAGDEVADRVEVEDDSADGDPPVAGPALEEDEAAGEGVAAGDLDGPAAAVDSEPDPRADVDRDARGWCLFRLARGRARLPDQSREPRCIPVVPRVHRLRRGVVAVELTESVDRMTARRPYTENV
jgi:hypothetical protein